MLEGRLSSFSLPLVILLSLPLWFLLHEFFLLVQNKFVQLVQPLSAKKKEERFKKRRRNLGRKKKKITHVNFLLLLTIHFIHTIRLLSLFLPFHCNFFLSLFRSFFSLFSSKESSPTFHQLTPPG